MTAQSPVPMWTGLDLGRSWASPDLTMKTLHDGAYMMQPLWQWTDDSKTEETKESERSGKEDDSKDDRKKFIPFNR